MNVTCCGQRISPTDREPHGGDGCGYSCKKCGLDAMVKRDTNHQLEKFVATQPLLADGVPLLVLCKLLTQFKREVNRAR